MMNALAQPTRMATFSLLARSGPAGLDSSEIADAVGIQRNLMSVHLTVLAKAGLVEQTRSGRNVRYRAVPAAAAELAAFVVRLATGTEPTQ